METFLASAVMAAVITSVANLVIGYKALLETRKLTKESRKISYFKDQRKELLKLKNELDNFKSLSSLELFLDAQKGDSKALGILVDNNRKDYVSLKTLYENYSIYFDDEFKKEINDKIKEYDIVINDYAEYIADKMIGNKKPKKQFDITQMINLSTNFQKLIEDRLNANLEKINKDYIKMF